MLRYCERNFFSKTPNHYKKSSLPDPAINSSRLPNAGQPKSEDIALITVSHWTD